MLGDLLEHLARFEAEVARGISVNVNGSATKQRAIGLGSEYFRDVRPELVAGLGSEDPLQEFDANWQHLIQLAHGNGPRRTYKAVLRELRITASTLNVHLLARPVSSHDKRFVTSKFENGLLGTLRAVSPTAAASYEQGLRDMAQSDLRLSYRGTATEFREAFREVLDHLAPDADVMSEPGFKLEEKRTLPTMKQKVRFVLISRGLSRSRRELTEKTADLVENLAGEVARAVYDRASVGTHTSMSRDEVRRLKRYVDTVLGDLLEIVE